MASIYDGLILKYLKKLSNLTCQRLSGNSASLLCHQQELKDKPDRNRHLKLDTTHPRFFLGRNSYMLLQHLWKRAVIIPYFHGMMTTVKTHWNLKTLECACHPPEFAIRENCEWWWFLKSPQDQSQWEASKVRTERLWWADKKTNWKTWTAVCKLTNSNIFTLTVACSTQKSLQMSQIYSIYMGTSDRCANGAGSALLLPSLFTLFNIKIEVLTVRYSSCRMEWNITKCICKRLNLDWQNKIC